MAYTDPVNFTKTGRYGCIPEDEDDVYTIDEFKKCVKSRMFVDYDGYGYPVRDGKSDPSIVIMPSKIEKIPNDATHIVWFNK